MMLSQVHRIQPLRRLLPSLRQIHKLSVASGPYHSPLLESTIPEHFASIVALYGDRPAVITRTPSPASTQTTLTYDALDTLSTRLAQSLRQLGVKKGDRIAISLGSTREFAALTYAVFKLGAVLVPLNPGFTIKQVENALRHLDVGLLILGEYTDVAYKPGCGRSNVPLLQDLVENLEGCRKGRAVESNRVPCLKRVVLLENATLHGQPETSKLLEGLVKLIDLEDGSDKTIIPDEPLKNTDVINIQFTSGTTSSPKAAMLTHRGILNNGHLIGERLNLTPEDRIVVPPPLFHCFGSVLGYMATATHGSAILMPSPAFDPVASLKMCVEENATGLYGVATMFISILDALSSGAVETRPSSLTKGIASGSSVPETLMHKLYANLGLKDISICYGMTETSPVSCMVTLDSPPEKRTTTVGQAMPHTTVKVVEPNNHSVTLPLGEKGELAVSGYLVMDGYWGDPSRTSLAIETDEDGVRWMFTGDEAMLDSEGYISITGRIKDLIIRGGENIHPAEIENVLLDNPDILEASCVGVPDEKYGEVVAVFVVARHGVQAPNRATGAGQIGDDDVREWITGHMSRHLVPKYIWWVENFPKTASGKVMKFKLREMASGLLRGKS